MTKRQAIQDAKQRTEKTGLAWHVIKIKQGIFKRSYDTVTEYHFITHSMLYKSGKFKKIYTCESDIETELDLNKSLINTY